MISIDKREALERRLDSLGIHEDDVIEKFIRGTGSGGQKINKTSSCVFLQHPSSQTEGIGNNQVQASTYGIKNLKIVAKNLENSSCNSANCSLVRFVYFIIIKNRPKRAVQIY